MGIFSKTLSLVLVLTLVSVGCTRSESLDTDASWQFGEDVAHGKDASSVEDTDSARQDGGAEDTQPSLPDVSPDDSGSQIPEEDAGADSDTSESETGCAFDFGTFDHVCDPVTNEGCSGNLRCVPSATGGALTLTCAMPQGSQTMSEGESCANLMPPETCGPGLYCLNWLNPDGRITCAKFCRMSTGEGCGADQFCTSTFEMLNDVGFCVDRCNPYAPDACDEGHVCAPDHQWAASRTCAPEFRCLRNGAPSEEVGYKSACSLSSLHTSGCPMGETCLQTDAGYQCVKPCQSDAACADVDEGLRCQPPQGEFGLRYCE